MPETPKHEYNVPNKGQQDWHTPVNDNFEEFDTDIEIRDVEANRNDYDPKQGAKFYATDKETVYLGDGSSWNRVPSSGKNPEFDNVTTFGTVTAGNLNTPSINVNNPTSLGVGTTSPEAKLHVETAVAQTGATNLARHAAVIENTSSDSTADVMALKTALDDPGEFANFLSLIDTDEQIGQIDGNGDGVRLMAKDRLDLGGAGNETLSVIGSDRTVEAGSTQTAQPTARLRVKDKKQVSNREQPTLELETDTYGAGVDFVADGTVQTRMRPNANDFQFEIRLQSDPLEDLYVGGGGLHVDGAIRSDSGLNVPSGTINGALDVKGTVTADSKQFRQTVETDEGQKEVVYTSTEAPIPRTETSGVARLADGRVEIDLPEHFAWVTDTGAPIQVQTTPYSSDSGGLAAVERSPERIVVEDLDGEGDYEFSYTVRGRREGHADKEIVREPSVTSSTDTTETIADD